MKESVSEDEEQSDDEDGDISEIDIPRPRSSSPNHEAPPMTSDEMYLGRDKNDTFEVIEECVDRLDSEVHVAKYGIWAMLKDQEEDLREEELRISKLQRTLAYLTDTQGTERKKGKRTYRVAKTQTLARHNPPRYAMNLPKGNPLDTRQKMLDSMEERIQTMKEEREERTRDIGQSQGDLADVRELAQKVSALLRSLDQVR